VTEAIVGCALIAVLENLISLVEFLETALGVTITRIAIRVEFHGELAISGLEIGVVSAPVDAKDLVIIALGHLTSPRHEADRPSRMPEEAPTERPVQEMDP